MRVPRGCYGCLYLKHSLNYGSYCDYLYYGLGITVEQFLNDTDLWKFFDSREESPCEFYTEREENGD